MVSMIRIYDPTRSLTVPAAIAIILGCDRDQPIWKWTMARKNRERTSQDCILLTILTGAGCLNSS